MLLLRGLVRSVFIKPASAETLNTKTGEMMKAQAATPYAVIEHEKINNFGVPVLEMVNVKLSDQEQQFRAAVGKEIVVACGHGQMNKKDWYNVPVGQLPIVQRPVTQ